MLSTEITSDPSDLDARVGRPGIGPRDGYLLDGVRYKDATAELRCAYGNRFERYDPLTGENEAAMKRRHVGIIRARESPDFHQPAAPLAQKVEEIDRGGWLR